MPTKKKPYYGTLKLENGQLIHWLRFAKSKYEAIRIVKAQHSQGIKK